jgi:sialate O-acetylesterase
MSISCRHGRISSCRRIATASALALLLATPLLSAESAQRSEEHLPFGFTAIGEWGVGIPGDDPELPTRFSAKPGVYCVYKPVLTQPAPVTVSIFRVSETGSSSRQHYEVHHHGTVDTVEVEFRGTSGWVTLGTFPFAGNGREYLKLLRGSTPSVRTAEVRFTILSPDGKQALRSQVIPTAQPTRPPPPPPGGAPRVAPKPVVLAPRPAKPALPPVASLQLPPHISDGMVIQRDRPVILTGRAPAGATVTVSLNGQSAFPTAHGGLFMAVLPPMRAGGPYELRIACGGEEKIVRDVLVGDVWICAGQSNMAMTVSGLSDRAEVLASADYPEIRYYKQYGGQPSPGSPVRWVAASAREAASFTAVGFLFARTLHRELKVPIGLVYAWRDGGDIRLFMRDEALAALATKIPFQVPTTPRTTLFSDFLAPLVGYPISGLLYYQGEGNHKEPLHYRDLLPAMVRDIRDLWGQGDFPFLCVQLPRYKDTFVGVREAQFLAHSAIPISALVVAIDCGVPDLLHPGDKRPIGERAARAALGLVHKVPGDYMGPMFTAATVSGNSLLARFAHAGSGLAARGELDGFTLCGEAGDFAPARAEIVGPDTVRIWRDDVARPVAARYLWSGAPRACLFNRAGFPASPFRTDPDTIDRVFDNRDPCVTTRGEWRTATLPGTFGPDALLAADTGPSLGASDWPAWTKWTFEVIRSGEYSVQVRWPEGLPATAAARIEVNAGGYGYPPIILLQSAGGGQWHKLGTFRLAYGNSDHLKLYATAAGAAADAVRIVFERE